MSEVWQGPLEKVDNYRYRIPKSYKSGMRVPGIIYADELTYDKAEDGEYYFDKEGGQWYKKDDCVLKTQVLF